MDAGMDVARINRSHEEQAEHEAVYRGVREAAKESGRNVAVLVDLQGPKIRLGRFAGDQKHYLNEGDTFTITTEDVEGTKASSRRPTRGWRRTPTSATRSSSTTARCACGSPPWRARAS
ncbi:hypothetical protein JCM11754A_11080 [Isoptericola variabilis]